MHRWDPQQEFHREVILKNCQSTSTAHIEVLQNPSLSCDHVQAYTTPVYFEEDWLNDYHDACQRGWIANGMRPQLSLVNLL